MTKNYTTSTSSPYYSVSSTGTDTTTCVSSLEFLRYFDLIKSKYNRYLNGLNMNDTNSKRTINLKIPSGFTIIKDYWTVELSCYSTYPVAFKIGFYSPFLNSRNKDSIYKFMSHFSMKYYLQLRSLGGKNVECHYCYNNKSLTEFKLVIEMIDYFIYEARKINVKLGYRNVVGRKEL